MNNKYEVFIQLLNFNINKYSAEKVFKDFISLFAISLSNKVIHNKENSEIYEKIYNSYEVDEQSNFYALATELTRIFCNENTPYDVLGEIYQKITNKCYLRLLNKSNQLQYIGKKLQGIMKINQKTRNGEMIEVNCGTGAMILAYASTLEIFKMDYKVDLKVTAIDTDIINVFMTYIQMYFYKIAAVVILVDESTNKEIMKLYTPFYENEEENLMVA